MKMALYCIEYSILVLLFSRSGGKNRLFLARVVVKKAEWWLGPTTPDQCGQNPVLQVLMININCTHSWNSSRYTSYIIMFYDTYLIGSSSVANIVTK